MKKTLVALAALAATASFAQSSVTLSGGLGFGYQKNPLNQKGFALTDFEIKLSGSEDLGGGLRANFSASLTDNGAARPGSSTVAAPSVQATGNYRSGIARDTTYLGLVGGFGGVTLMNTRTAEMAQRAFVAPSSLPDGFYDGAVFSRVPVDVLQYTTPNFSGFTGVLGFSESGANATNSDGNLVTPRLKTTSVGLNYANGPLAASLFVRNTKDRVNPSPLARKTNSEGVITYDFGVAQVGFGFDGKRTNVATDKMAYALGVAVPIGAFTVGLNYAARGTTVVGAKKDTISEFVANYALSKRTAIMFAAGQQTGPATTSASANAAAFQTGTLLPVGSTKEASQYRLKLQHNF